MLLICFCDDGDDSENSNKAGREESIGARSPGEGASAEPSYRKRRADPGDDVGPSSVRRRLESEKESNPAFTADPEINARVAPPTDPASSSGVRTSALPSLTEEEEAQLWKQSDDWILKNLSRLENKIQDEVHRLRKEEGMRALGPERMARTVEDLTEKYGLEKIPEILNEIKTKGK